MFMTDLSVLRRNDLNLLEVNFNAALLYWLWGLNVSLFCDVN